MHPKGPLRVSGGVMAGNLVRRVMPVYPSDPNERGPNGAVVLSVTIKKTGAVENVNVISGPAVMAKADADAVRQWVYRP